MLELIRSNAITVTCIGSWALTSTSIDNMINRPIWSLLLSLFWGGIAGVFVAAYTPKGFEVHVVVGIIGMTTVGLIAKGFRRKENINRR